MGEFPDGYPEDLLDRILAEGRRFESVFVYRVAQYGLENPDSFLSTILNSEKYKLRRVLNPEKLSTYSTSCCATKTAAAELLGLFLRKLPKAEIVEGDIKPELGPCRICENSPHVDWWLFKGAAPWLYFVRTEV